MKEKIKNFIGFLKKHKKKTAVIITVLVLVFLMFPRKYEMWVTDGGSHYWGYNSLCMILGIIGYLAVVWKIKKDPFMKE